MTTVPGDLAEWLRLLTAGDRTVLDRIIPLVYDDLRDIARRQLRRRRPGETLQTTGLVHEVYVRLSERSGLRFADAEHFLAASATIMRHIVVDHARRNAALKRGGPAGADPAVEPGPDLLGEAETVLAVDDALRRLERLNPRLAAVVELRFFGGFSVEETARLLKIDGRTVKRDWHKARLHLAESLADGGPA